MLTTRYIRVQFGLFLIYCTWFFYYIDNTNCTVPFETVIVNVSGSVNITPCFGVVRYEIGIFNESLSRAEAEYSCIKRGYRELLSSPQGWKRLFHVKDVLVSNRFPENITFWEGDFRPFFHTYEWFGPSCKSYTNFSVSGMIGQFDQCAGVHWDSYSSAAYLVAKNCSEQLPFLCYLQSGSLYFEIYNGYAVDTFNLSNMSIMENDTFTNYDDCSQFCQDQNDCIGFTFNYTISSCSLVNIKFNNGRVTYWISPQNYNVTHGAKSGCSVAVDNSLRNFTLSDISDILPDCGLPPIPPDYCMCCDLDNSTITTAEMEQVLQGLINNLTVQKKSTFVNQLKYTSVYDERPSSVFFGTVGIVVLTIVFSLPVISDIITFKFNVNRKSSKQKRKQQQQKRLSTSSLVSQTTVTTEC